MLPLLFSPPNKTVNATKFPPNSWPQHRKTGPTPKNFHSVVDLFFQQKYSTPTKSNTSAIFQLKTKKPKTITNATIQRNTFFPPQELLPIIYVELISSSNSTTETLEVPSKLALSPF